MMAWGGETESYNKLGKQWGKKSLLSLKERSLNGELFKYFQSKI